ncbi:MAG: precorrin-6y C5,15-methyltransferase (decarboxylating) subunit CbiE [Hahellaceae bacterium]|nr:precorrin-6y C5,15-methyltransferase (decarboxylating) subunit CbiE [Hahellaceae bacterium]MCP5170162.1 precorrin-6y C5,15-methyltransferase (decarboxylating) subunit CbiE [Hahellaceae bacterium]
MSIHVIGLGVAAQAFLDEEALAALQAATRVVGSERQIATVRWWLGAKQTVEILPALPQLKEKLASWLADGTENIAILASGDPLFYGIGKWVKENAPSGSLRFYPAVSSVQVACHRLGVSLQDVTVLSLHGRPLAKLLTQLRRGQALMLLTDAQSRPQQIAALCVDAGFADSELVVCEALGYPHEKVTRYHVSQLTTPEADRLKFDPLQVTYLEVRGSGTYLPAFPGIPDTNFVTDREGGKGMLTKREIRLAILSWLQPGGDDCIWDIGAGCGSVAVELSYWCPDVKVYAIEHHPERVRCLTANQARFGVVSNLHIVEGRAPDVCESLPTPDKVFIGGSGGELTSLLELAWARLPYQGVLLVSAVTEATRQGLYRFYQQREQVQDVTMETLEVAIRRGETLAGELLYRPGLPVTLYRFEKCRLSPLPVESDSPASGDWV